MFEDRAPTLQEMEDLLARVEASMDDMVAESRARLVTTRRTRKPRRQMSPALAGYWAGSASESVCADYRSGNVVTIQA